MAFQCGRCVGIKLGGPAIAQRIIFTAKVDLAEAELAQALAPGDQIRRPNSTVVLVIVMRRTPARLCRYGQFGFANGQGRLCTCLPALPAMEDRPAVAIVSDGELPSANDPRRAPRARTRGEKVAGRALRSSAAASGARVRRKTMERKLVEPVGCLDGRLRPLDPTPPSRSSGAPHGRVGFCFLICRVRIARTRCPAASQQSASPQRRRVHPSKG